MTPVEVARMVNGLDCDCCGTVFVLQPGELHDTDHLRGVELVGKVLPYAVGAGWRPTVRNTYRCPADVEKYGLDAVSRRTWSEVFNSRPAARDPGAPPG